MLLFQGNIVKKAQKICSLLKQSLSNLATGVRIRDDVAGAIANNKPVVALESTIITHGLPQPQNLDVALSVEGLIRDNGAIPATIGILDGELIIGMSKDEMISLVSKKDIVKASRRDLSYVMSRGANGGTTVSGTMVAAHMAGIDVFVTGGIGGVHRGASETFDISADLMELSRTPVAVVCSGVKSILDIGLTLEYLETQGVPVITHAPTRDFPAFFTPKSKFKAPYHSESTKEIAELIHKQCLMGLNTGVVVGVPIPCEGSIDGDKIEHDIECALKEASKRGIAGKDITPFLLGVIRERTKGESLESNIALVENNAKVGAKIAVDLAELKSSGGNHRPQVRISTSSDLRNAKQSKRPVVIGGCNFDIKASVNSISAIAEDTNIGKLHTSFGGVGRNITECLGRLGTNPFLISSVGRDHQGDMLLNNLHHLGIDTSGVSISDTPTASYSIVANNSSGELVMAVGDMDNHDEITSKMINGFQDDIAEAAIVVLDGNLSESTLQTALKLCEELDVPTWFDPTTVSRAVRPFTGDMVNHISYMSPNYEELKAIHEFLISQGKCKGENTGGSETSNILDGCLTFIDNLIITLGKNGVLVASKKPYPSIFSKPGSCEDSMGNGYCIQHYPAASECRLPVAVKSVSGAGDSFASGVLYGYLQGYDTDTCVKGGLLAAYKSLHTYDAISDEITPDLLSHDNINRWAVFDATTLSEDAAKFQLGLTF